MFSICPSACPCMRVCGHAGGRHSLAYCLFYGSFYVVVSLSLPICTYCFVVEVCFL